MLELNLSSVEKFRIDVEAAHFDPAFKEALSELDKTRVGKLRSLQQKIKEAQDEVGDDDEEQMLSQNDARRRRCCSCCEVRLCTDLPIWVVLRLMHKKSKHI